MCIVKIDKDGIRSAVSRFGWLTFPPYEFCPVFENSGRLSTHDVADALAYNKSRVLLQKR